jgi:hypothetical protein
MKKLINSLNKKLNMSDKKLLIIFLSLYIYLIIFSIAFCYFAVKSVTPSSTKIIPIKKKDKTQIIYKSSADISREIFKCYNEGLYGPMMSVKGTLKNKSTKKEIYWIFLGGLEKVKNQTTTMKESILSAANLNNQYKKNVKKHILKNIPKNSTLILSGHSLGGMISQQLAADKDIKSNYKILYIIGFGSPYISTAPKEGKVVRLTDRNDLIGYMIFANPFKYNRKENNVHYKKSSYLFKCPAHLWSYNDFSIWKDYDVIGSKTDNTTFTFMLKDKTYYKSTYLKKQK